MPTNLERITAHNERLAAMKETVAALPDAGSGGGGSVETQRITINAINANSTRHPTVTYVNANGEFETLEILDDVAYIDCAKNGFILIMDVSEVLEIIGSAEIVFSGSSQYLFDYWGDATIHIKD